MATPTEFHFYEDSFSRLDTALTTYVGDTASDIIGSISGVAYSMLMIYMMLWGWSMLRGLISEPITDGVTRIIRLSVIVGIALNLGHYNTYVASFLWNTPDAMAGIVASGYSDSASNVQFLDQLMGRIYDLGDMYWQKANAAGSFLPDVGLLLVALFIWVAGVASTAYGAFLLVLSKMALAILLGVGPIFVLLTLFESTKRFFESWLGQALNYVFLVILTAAAIKLILSIIAIYLGVATPGVAADPTIDLALPCIVLCVIAGLIMMQLPSIASSLGGGVAISTLSAAGWTYGKAKGGLVGMRPTNVRRSLHKARSDVRIAGGAAKAVGAVPMAVYRRIIRGRGNRVEPAAA